MPVGGINHTTISGALDERFALWCDPRRRLQCREGENRKNKHRQCVPETC
ncbi:MAG: hypothetical protein ACI89J_001403 [Hyphomicrobiaceae bacterium]|jgi:hypothetical protein